MNLQVAVVIASQTDLPLIEESGMLEILDQCGIQWELSIISADRNPEVLSDYCEKARKEKVRVFIAAAGMAARLPGTIAAHCKYLVPVIGVALPSEEFPDAMDSLLSITRVSSGCPVLFAGVGKAGLKNASLAAAQILANSQDEIGLRIRDKLIAYFLNNRKEPQIGIRKNLGAGR